MNWADKLYIGNRIEKKYPNIRKALDASGYPGSAYLLTLPVGPHNQLEIISTGQFLKNKPYVIPPVIVGMAADYKEALELLVKIAEETRCQTGTADLRAYLEGRG